MTTLVSPVQFDEQPTMTRVMTRSMRSSALATITAIPGRVVRQVRRRLFPIVWSETDREDEKERYFAAVVASIER